jgi:hypothetical protein
MDSHGHTQVLDGPTLGEIWVGDLVWWNDTRIAQLNPNVTATGFAFPEERIRLVSADDIISSISQMFGNFIASHNPEFAAQWDYTSSNWTKIAGIADHLTNTGKAGPLQPAYVKVATHSHNSLFLARSLEP